MIYFLIGIILFAVALVLYACCSVASIDDDVNGRDK